MEIFCDLMFEMSNEDRLSAHSFGSQMIRIRGI